MRYQYDNKGLAAICLYCGQNYSKHLGRELKCPKINKNIKEKSIQKTLNLD